MGDGASGARREAAGFEAVAVGRKRLRQLDLAAAPRAPGPKPPAPVCGITIDDEAWRRSSCSSRIARSTHRLVASA